MTATVAPVAAPRPAAAKAQAAAPSRGPQPARLNGIAATTRTARARAASSPVARLDPGRAGGDHEDRRVAGGRERGERQHRRYHLDLEPVASDEDEDDGGQEQDSPEGRGREGQGGRLRGDRPGDQDHEPCERDLRGLADHPLGRHRPHRPVRDSAVHVAEHAARQHGVEELGPVIRCDPRAQRHPDSVRPAHQAPALGAGHGRQCGEYERGHDRRRADGLQPRHERFGPHPRREHGQHHQPARGLGDRPPPSTHPHLPDLPYGAGTGGVQTDRSRSPPALVEEGRSPVTRPRERTSNLLVGPDHK